MTLKKLVDELLVRTQQTQNQKIVTELIASAVDELEHRITAVERELWPQLMEDVPLEAPRTFHAEKVGRSNWYAIIDSFTGVEVDKVQGEEAAQAKLEELQA